MFAQEGDNINKIRSLRKEKGISLREFARIFSVAPSTMSYWERGTTEPDHSTTQKLAEYFNVSIDYLLGTTDNPSPVNDRGTISPETVKFGLLGVPADEMSDSAYNEIVNFAKYILAREQKKAEEKERRNKAPQPTLINDEDGE